MTVREMPETSKIAVNTGEPVSCTAAEQVSQTLSGISAMRIAENVARLPVRVVLREDARA
jgi:hypothetical protein